ncbi:MAG: Crp/Fnr family transcriptional regulator [Desulforhopalus sp.]
MSFTAAAINSDLKTRLQAFSFFTGLSPEAQQELLHRTRPVILKDGVQLIDQGGECATLLLVERGGVRVHKDSSSGRAITLYVVNPGEVCILGVSSMLGGTDYQACATVDSQTDALSVPASLFKKLFAQEDTLRQFVMNIFSTRLGDFMELVEDVAFRKMDERLANFLIEKSSREVGVFHPVVMTHDQIAVYLGTAREVVSRLLHQFVKEELVSLARGKVFIADPVRLKKRCS